MPETPSETLTAEDVRHARAAAESMAGSSFDAVKGPLFAALGAVDTATQAVIDAFGKARAGATERAEEAQGRVQKALHELQVRASDLPHEVAQLRHRLEPAELRKTAEEYREAAQRAYTSLSERGEEVFDELRSQPRVQQALGSVEAGVDTAQGRLEAAVRELNAAIEDLLARFARTSRSVGEKAARRAEGASAAAAEQIKETAGEVSEAVSRAGQETATTTRSTSRKVAERASPSRKPTHRRPGDNASRKS